MKQLSINISKPRCCFDLFIFGAASKDPFAPLLGLTFVIGVDVY